MSEESGQKPNPREVVFSDGRRVIVNLKCWTWAQAKEYAYITIPPRLPELLLEGKELEEYEAKRAVVLERERAAMAKYYEMRGQACGMTAEEVAALGYEDQAKLGEKIIQLLRDPIGADPN